MTTPTPAQIDIVERLRGNDVNQPWSEEANAALMGEAAAEIAFLRREIERLNLIKRITIERCAQVVDEFAAQHQSGLGCHPAIRAMLETAATTIRALAK